MALEVVTNNGHFWSNLLKAISPLLSEVTFVFTAEGVRFQRMDYSHVALVELRYPASGFTRYRCDTPSPVPLCVYLRDFAQGLKLVNLDQPLTLLYDPSVTDTVLMLLSDGGTRVTELKLLQFDEEPLTIPELTYPTVLSMPSKVFRKLIQDMRKVGDTVRLEVTPHQLVTRVEGKEGVVVNSISDSSHEPQAPTNPADRVIINSPKPLQQSLAIRYLAAFCQHSIADRLEIRLGIDTPAVFHSQLSDCVPESESATGTGYLRFYLAPKIEGL
jgi:proliferating cell nuclear antigen